MKKSLGLLLAAILFFVTFAVPSAATPPSQPYAEFNSIERFETFVQCGEIERLEGCRYQCYYEWDEKVLIAAAAMANQDGLIVPETEDVLSTVSFSADNTLASYEYRYSYKDDAWSVSVFKPSQLCRELLEAEGVKLFFESRYGTAYSELSECEVEIAGRKRAAYRIDRSAWKSVIIEHGSLLILFHFSEEFSDTKVSDLLREIQFRPQKQGRGWIWIPVFLTGVVVIVAIITILLLRKRKAKRLAGADNSPEAPAEGLDPPPPDGEAPSANS